MNTRTTSELAAIAYTEATTLAAQLDAIKAGIFNDLGSGSNVDLCVITKEGHKMTVRVDADEIFPNCPRYIPDLNKAAASSFIPDETGASAKPEWKNAEDLRDALPAKDPHRQ